MARIITYKNKFEVQVYYKGLWATSSTYTTYMKAFEAIQNMGLRFWKHG
jgi:hypothetical protein